MGLDKRLVIG